MVMSKIKLMLNIVEDMRSLADSIQALCDVANENEVSKPTPKVSKTKVNVKAEITLETVRGVLAEKSQQGKTAEVREIIAKFGGTKLSEISTEYYADILKDAEVL